MVVCPAHGARGWADRARAAGCNEYVTKPVDFDALAGAIKRLLARTL